MQVHEAVTAGRWTHLESQTIRDPDMPCSDSQKGRRKELDTLWASMAKRRIWSPHCGVLRRLESITNYCLEIAANIGYILRVSLSCSLKLFCTTPSLWTF